MSRVWLAALTCCLCSLAVTAQAVGPAPKQSREWQHVQRIEDAGHVVVDVALVRRPARVVTAEVGPHRVLAGLLAKWRAGSAWGP